MPAPIREIAADERQRSYLLPTRIVRTFGHAENADSLLSEHPLQIHLNEENTLLLDNRGSGEKAGVLLDFGRELHGGVRLLGFRPEGAGYPAPSSGWFRVTRSPGSISVEPAPHCSAMRI